MPAWTARVFFRGARSSHARSLSHVPPASERQQRAAPRAVVAVAAVAATASTRLVLHAGTVPFAPLASMTDEADFRGASASPGFSRADADQTLVRCQRYDSLPSVCESDHKPVVATLSVELPEVDLPARRTAVRRLLRSFHKRVRKSAVRCSPVLLRRFHKRVHKSAVRSSPALCESALLSCSEFVLLSCSNSPSWPRRSRCRVSAVTHTPTVWQSVHLAWLGVATSVCARA